MIPLFLSFAAWGEPRGVVTDVQAPKGLENAFAPRRVALVIGIDTYSDEALGSLRYAAKDAHDLSRVLLNPEQGDFDLVSEVTGTVTRTSFWSAFDAATSHLQRDDTFVLFVAGHGTLDLTGEGTELYLLTSDAALDHPAESGIAVREIERKVQATAARRRVTVLDTCHSGTGRSKVAPTTEERIQGLRGPLPAVRSTEVGNLDVRMYAAHLNQPALEDSKLENGVYSHFLVEALSGQADADGDGLVEVLEAHAWARDRTMAYTGGLQVPWVETRQVGREAIILAGEPVLRVAAESAVLTGLEGLPVGATLRVDGTPRGGGDLPPGEHEVEILLGERPVARTQVDLKPGEQLDVATLARDRGPHMLLGAGVQAMAGGAWLPAWALQTGGWWLPTDAHGPRPALGLSVARSVAGAPDTATIRSGQALLQGGYFFFDRIGPTVGVGGVWRQSNTGPQGAPAFSVGLHAHQVVGPVAMTLDPSLLFFATDVGPVALPGLVLSLSSFQ